MVRKLSIVGALGLVNGAIVRDALNTNHQLQTVGLAQTTVGQPQYNRQGTQNGMFEDAMQTTMNMTDYIERETGIVTKAPQQIPEQSLEKTNDTAQSLEKTNVTKSASEPEKQDPSLTEVVSIGGSSYDQKQDPGQRANIIGLVEKKDEEKALTVEPLQGANKLGSGGFMVELSNDGSGYVGTIYVGSNDNPVKVLFDTGSDYLAITSSLCLDPKLGKKEEDEPVYDAKSFSYKSSGKDHRKCKSSAYNMQESTTAKAMGGSDEQLDFGSAKLNGKLVQDKTCAGESKEACANLEFLALYQAKGLDDTDGILGLAVHPDANKKALNYVWQLKQQGIINNALVSFSFSGPGQSDMSYAQFGGINENQIVGGAGGLEKMQTKSHRADNSVKQWALDGQTMLYGTEECTKKGGEKSYSAIMDSGSSYIGLPSDMFWELKTKWKKDLPDMDCVIDDNFCQVMTPCDQIASKLKPVSFQISGQVFELSPQQYLHQAEEKRCQFAISGNQMKGRDENLVLIGDTLLRHLYQVYDFENEAISLGVNKHSDGQLLMYPAGKRPENAAKIQMEENNMSPEIGQRFND